MPKDKIGTLNNEFTLNIDLAPTILGAANLEAPSVMQGRNIADLYLGHGVERTQRNQKAWREEFYYIFPEINDRIPASRALVQKDWKYIDWFNNGGVEELFNMIDDPYELNNLAISSKYDSLKVEMRNRLDKLEHEASYPYIPRTMCSQLWGAGRKDSNKRNCSNIFPEQCCQSDLL